jgi:uncharacterized membrane protein
VISWILDIVFFLAGWSYILLAPGLAISYILFSPREIDKIERFALGLALSIGVIPFVEYYLSLTGIPLTAFNLVLLINIITCIGIALALWRSHRKEL